MQEEERDIHALTDEQHRRLAQVIMRRQAALSLRVALIFIILVLGLPLVNYYLPQWANTPVFGFTATWLFLGVLFFPITWLLSYYFVRQSDRIEAECADWRTVLGEPPPAAAEDDVVPAFTGGAER